MSHAAEHKRNNTQHVTMGTVFTDRSGRQWQVNWCNGLIVEAFNSAHGNRDFPVGMIADLLRHAADGPPVCSVDIEMDNPDEGVPGASQPAVVRCSTLATRRITTRDLVIEAALCRDGHETSMVCDHHAAELRAAARRLFQVVADEALPEAPQPQQ